jgi:hypothetical protein
MKDDESDPKLKGPFGEIPLSVAMRGPAAIMGYLLASEGRQAEQKQRGDRVMALGAKMMGLLTEGRQDDDTMSENITALAINLCATTIVRTEGSRAKARDILARVLDEVFDLLEKPVGPGGKSWVEEVTKGFADIRAGKSQEAVEREIAANRGKTREELLAHVAEVFPKLEL